MGLENLFTVPAGQKVTEKHLRRVLISSICSILLCMTCLVSTTWAWFAVSIENSENVIRIGTPEVKLTVNSESFASGNALRAEENHILIEHANELDDLQKKSTLYVTFSVNDTVQGYVILDSSNGYKTDLTLKADEGYPLSWTTSWFKPDNVVNDITNKEIEAAVGAAEPTETAAPTQTAEPTETAAPTQTAEPTETAAPTQTAAEPSTEQTAAPTTAAPTETEPAETAQTEVTVATEPTAQTTAPTEVSQEQ